MPADTDSHTGTDSHTDTAQAGADLNGLLRHTFDQSRLVIGTVGADDVSKTTPCPAFDVRTLVGHMLFAAERIGAAGRRTAGESDNAVTVVPDDQWVPAFERAAADAVAVWREPGALEGDIVLPFGTFPAAVVAMMYIVEQATHAWDLAIAIDATGLLDQQLAEEVLPLARQVIRLEFRGEEPMPFGAEVAVAAAAPATDRLAGFMGRRPRGTMRG